MAPTRQDVEFRLRAVDQSKRTIQDTTSAVRTLTGAIKEQVEAAAKGEVSTAELNESLKALGKTGDEIAKSGALVLSFRQQEERLGILQQALDQARAKEEAFRQSLVGVENVTKTQARELDRLERATLNANNAYSKGTETLANMSRELKAVGVDLRDLDNVENKLFDTFRQNAAGIATLNSALENYHRNLRETKAAAAAMAAENSGGLDPRNVAAGNAVKGAGANAQKLEQDARYVRFWTEALNEADAAEKRLADAEGIRAAAVASAKLQDSAQYVRFWTEALDAADLAAKELAAGDAIRTTASKAQQLEEDARYVRFWTEALNEADVAEKKLAANRALDQKSAEQLAQFRALADGARQAASGYKVLEASNMSLSGASTTLAQSLRAISDPALTARSTLAGLESQADQLGSAIGKLKGVTANYAGAAREISELQRSAVGQAEQIDAYRRQAANVTQLQTALHDARQELDQYIRLVRNAGAEDKELASALVQARSAVNSLTGELAGEVGQLNALERGLKAAGIDTKNLDAAEQRLKTTTIALAASQKQLANVTTGRGAKGVQGLFGLKPYELQNLGFQVNDVFTQLASGASITQTLAQQGGQILQIFPGLFGKLVSYLPRLTLLGAAIGGIALGVGRMKENEGAVRAFDTQLKSLADGSRYSAENLAALQRQLTNNGVAFEDVGQAISVFVQKGLDPSRIKEFTQAAKNMALVHGGELAQSAEQVFEAFTRGYEAIAEFDSKMNFLSVTERNRIRELFESGDAEKARREAFEAFAEKSEDAAEKARGPWASAWSKLSTALSDFLNWLSKQKIIQDFGTALDNLAGAIGRVGETISQRINGVSPLEETKNELEAVNKQLDDIDQKKKDIAAAPGLSLGSVTAGDQPTGGGLPSRPDTGEIDQTRSALLMRRATLEQKIVDLQKEQNARSFDGTSLIQEQMVLSDERARQSEIQNKKADDYLDTLARQLMTNKLATREERIAAEAEKARLEAAKEGLNNKQVQAAVDLRVAAKKREIDKEEAEKAKQEAARREAEANRQEAANKRLINQERELAAARRGFDSQQDTLGIASLEDRLRAVDEKFDDLIAKAKEFQAAGGKEIRGASVDQFVSDANSTRDQIKALATLKFYEDEANARIKERNDLVQTYTNLVQAGAMTTTEAQEKIRAAYESTGPAIASSVQNATALLQVLKEQGLITEEVFNRVTAKLQEIVSQTQYLDPNVQKFVETVQEGLAGGAVEIFDEVAKSIAGIVQGTQSLDDLWKNLGSTIAQVAAQFIREVAMMILKLYALKLAQEITGMSGNGGNAGGDSLLVKVGTALIGAPKQHGGGMAGLSNISAPVDASMFLNARRYHSGTPSVGLGPHEVPAILEEGERVLSKEENMRKGFRSGGGENGLKSARFVLVDDKRNALAALNTPEGEEVFVQQLTRNVPTLKTLLRMG